MCKQLTVSDYTNLLCTTAAEFPGLKVFEYLYIFVIRFTIETKFIERNNLNFKIEKA